MDTQDLGNLKGFANLLKAAHPGAEAPAPAAPIADQGTAKIPLTMLPPMVQPGQRIALTITGIDPVSGMATVVTDAAHNAVPSAPAAAEVTPRADAVDRQITMGPMDNFKSYLFQKTQEQEGQ